MLNRGALDFTYLSMVAIDLGQGTRPKARTRAARGLRIGTYFFFRSSSNFVSLASSSRSNLSITLRCSRSVVISRNARWCSMFCCMTNRCETPRKVAAAFPLTLALDQSSLRIREAEGGTGGIFLFKRSALRFAERNSGARGCATMFLTERLELDLANRGNRLVGWIGAVLNVLARCIPEYPPPIPMVQKKQKGEWQ